MGIGSWFKRWRQEGDAETIQRAEEYANESAEERRYSREGVMGVQADDFAARTVGRGESFGDAERLGDR